MRPSGFIHRFNSYVPGEKEKGSERRRGGGSLCRHFSRSTHRGPSSKGAPMIKRRRRPCSHSPIASLALTQHCCKQASMDDSPLPSGRTTPRAPPPSSSSSSVANADEGESDDWYVHAHEEEGGPGAVTQGPMSRAGAAQSAEEGGGRLMVWHPTATKAWTPWNEVRPWIKRLGSG